MPEPKTSEAVLGQLADGASLSLQARKTVQLYRTSAVKISNVTGRAMKIENIDFIAEPSDELAKIAYMKKHPLPENDDAGTWTVSAIHLRMSHCE